MPRGKYQKRKQNRDAMQLAADVARVRAQLADEQTRLAEARERAALDAKLRTELADAIAARDAACAPQLNRIAADRDVIRTATRELAATTHRMRQSFEKITEWALREAGPEYYYALTTGNRIQWNRGVFAKGLESSTTEAIQRARGLRKEPAPDFTREQRYGLAVATAAATGIALPDDVKDTDDGAWDAYTKQIGADAAAVISFITPPPWLDITCDGEHPVSQVLGANPTASAMTVDPADTIPTMTALSTGSTAQREAVTAAGATAVAKAFTPSLQHNVNRAAQSHIPSMVADSPAYPAPADAASMQAWYAASAIGAWGRHRTSVNGRVAVAAAAAVPFWLPPGHTVAYLDSEPLSGEDIDDMRLPFPQVLVTFAEPARLPSVDPRILPDEDPRLRWIDHLLATNDGQPEARDILIGGTNNFTSPPATLWDAIASRGAHIEAVLLLADAHGHLEDLFAWCVTVPSATAGAVIGRWAIPASRRNTSYANLVANAAAVAAWADWHRPGHSRDVNEPETEYALEDASNSRQRPEDTVHVLNVTATTPAEPLTSTRGEPTGRTTAPHRRRGHWRRQHYGPGRTMTRRIRIAPVLVNAGRVGSDRPQVYRLPPAVGMTTNPLARQPPMP